MRILRGLVLSLMAALVLMVSVPASAATESYYGISMFYERQETDTGHTFRGLCATITASGTVVSAWVHEYVYTDQNGVMQLTSNTRNEVTGASLVVDPDLGRATLSGMVGAAPVLATLSALGPVETDLSNLYPWDTGADAINPGIFIDAFRPGDATVSIGDAVFYTGGAIYSASNVAPTPPSPAPVP